MLTDSSRRKGGLRRPQLLEIKKTKTRPRVLADATAIERMDVQACQALCLKVTMKWPGSELN